MVDITTPFNLHFLTFVPVMLDAFQKQLLALENNPAGKKFLLAVSGGLDSAVLAELFALSAFDYSIAHCNFQLRGKESDGDENFVKKLAAKSNVSFFSVKFETEKFCADNRVSVQMGARQLRYEWLKEIKTKNKFDYIVTAHHADDSIETFFINLLRGTGIAGLKGIRAKNEDVIRPMLGFYRAEIEKFAKKNKLKWREDSSNSSDKYERNRIRHHVIPALEKTDENAKRNIRQSMSMLASVEEIYRKAIAEKASEFVKKDKTKVEIDLGLFAGSKHTALYLYELIKEFGFGYDQTEMVVACISKKEYSGKEFYSNYHRLVIDRKSLSVIPIKKEEGKSFMVNPGFKMINLGDTYCWFEKLKKTKNFKPDPSPEIAALDFDKLSFPLQVRKWKQGDRFYPLGMQKPKKLSNFLIDNKVSVLDKEQVYVLVSGSKIAWIMGYRIDDRFKVTSATKNLYLCKLQKAISL